jgi:hypothetical protein
MLFTSIDKVHAIELVIFGDIAELSIISFHYESYKTFLLLLKKVIEYMTSKNINYVKQRILESDIPLFNNSTFVHTNDNNRDNNQNQDQDHSHGHSHIRTVLITTPIVHIVEEIYNALGLQRV